MDDFEVIVVDDCSTDLSVSVVREYIRRDSRVRMARLPANGGPSAARNVGLSLASGEFVGFVDADDWVAPGMYAELLSLVQRTQAASARCGQTIETISGRFTRAYVPDQEPDGDFDGVLLGRFSQGPGKEFDEEVVLGYELYRAMFGDICKPLLSACNALYLRSVLDAANIRFDEDMYNLEDVLFNAQFFATNPLVAFSPQPLYHIWTTEGSLSRTSSRLKESYAVLVRRIRELEEENLLAKGYRQSFQVYRAAVPMAAMRTWLRQLGTRSDKELRAIDRD